MDGCVSSIHKFQPKNVVQALKNSHFQFQTPRFLEVEAILFHDHPCSWMEKTDVFSRINTQIHSVNATDHYAMKNNFYLMNMSVSD